MKYQWLKAVTVRGAVKTDKKGGRFFFYFLLPYMEIRKGGRKTFFPSGIRIEKESKICFVIFHSMLPSFLVGFEVSFLFRITNNS